MEIKIFPLSKTDYKFRAKLQDRFLKKEVIFEGVGKGNKILILKPFQEQTEIYGFSKVPDKEEIDFLKSKIKRVLLREYAKRYHKDLYELMNNLTENDDN